MNYSANQISAYYLELERLIERIERATTHYQVLGIERTATPEQIKAGYYHTMKLLKLLRFKTAFLMPPDMVQRLRGATEKASAAFFVLMHFGKRTEYDNALRDNAKAPINVDKILGQKPPANPQNSQLPSAKINDLRREQRVIVNRGTTGKLNAKVIHATEAIVRSAANKVMFTKPVELTSEKVADRTLEKLRRFQRFNLSLPTYVAGYGKDGKKWQEMTHTIDVSKGGVSLRLTRRLRHGQVVHLTMPFPVKLRNHGFGEPSYKIYAIVRRIEPLKNGSREMGLEFLQEAPPNGYHEKPASVYRTESWQGQDRRREPRKALKETVTIEYLNQMMHTIGEEKGLTENISAGGMRVCLQAVPPELEVVKVISPTHNFNSLAVIRNRFFGSDKLERLCLQFVDKQWNL
ncbi:MAG: PilZ domain-containing protein [Acidobacteriota bacterium]